MSETDEIDIDTLKLKLNQETAKISWSSLAQYQQQQAVVEVHASLDLIAVACEFVQDNRQQVETWLQYGLVSIVGDEAAKTWEQENTELWAVVVAPWVLVQQPGAQK